MSSQLRSEASFESSMLGFFYRQWMLHRKPVPAGTNLSSQVAIITGSNSGLGLESGRQLLQLGLSHLVLAVRSQSRGNEAADGLRKEFPGANVSVWLLDMNSYDSIVTFVDQCKSLPKINMVILNAGLKGSDSFTTTKDTGHEYSVQVNYISTALLAILLLPVLKSLRVAGSKPPVLSIVTSDSAFWASIETQGPILAQLDRAESYSAMQWYQKAKLLQYFFVSKLAEEVDADDVIVNLANPGLCAGSEFGKSSTSAIVLTFFSIVGLVLGRTLATGASTYVDAVVVKGEESHGSLVSDWAIRPYPEILYTQEGAQVRERLWEETMEELNFARVSDVIQRMKR
ncbi:retinol dehydrogenase 12 [Xylariaceae sp. AK1471]|nr:retinol dehydrogenase 12 [Xylariaceae sp. AK1471]